MLKRRLIALLPLTWIASARAITLADLSGKDATGGLKEALTQSATKAIEQLGKTDGFLGNPKVKIPLPENLQKVDGLMRKLGLGKYSDELITAMNRAAEAAAPQAKTLLVNAVKQMSVQDAKAILTGGDTAGTQYFQRTTSAPLGEKFKPIVVKALAKVKLAEKYDQFAGKAASLGLVKEADSHLDGYVTGKALDGMFSLMADEEKAIRKDPVGAVGALAKKVFGLLR